MKLLIQNPVSIRIPSLRVVNDKPIVSGTLFYMKHIKDLTGMKFG